MMVVEPSMATIMMEENLVLKVVFDLENPPFGLGGRVGHCSRIWLRQLEKA